MFLCSSLMALVHYERALKRPTNRGLLERMILSCFVENLKFDRLYFQGIHVE